MGLTVANFVPDGIVIASDSIVEVRNQDDGFIQSELEKLFLLDSKYVLAIEGCGFFDGLPISYYIHRFLHKSLRCACVADAAELICHTFSDIFPREPIMAYVAGYDYQEDIAKPVVLFIHDNQHDFINTAQDGTVVYNFHSIGRTHWVNKLLMHTKGVVGDEVVDFQGHDIDFSKYSLSYAKEFTEKLISISEFMDNASQLKPMVGGRHQFAIIRPYDEPYLIRP